MPLYIYLYILAALDSEYYQNIAEEDILRVHIYISRYDDPFSNADTNVLVELPWEVENSSILFELDSLNNLDWNGTFILSRAQWLPLSRSGIRVKSTDRLTVEVSNEYNGSVTSYLGLSLTERATTFSLTSQPVVSSTTTNVILIGTVHLSATVRVYSSTQGEILTLTVPPYRVVDLSANVSNALDITGFHVTSSSPIVVFMGSSCESDKVTTGDSGECESWLQQVPPIKSLMNQYCVGPVGGAPNDNGLIVRMVFADSHNDVTIEWQSEQNILNVTQNGLFSCNISRIKHQKAKVICPLTTSAGSFVDVQISNSSSPILIENSKGCLALQQKRGVTMSSQNSTIYRRGFVTLLAPLELRNQQVRLSTVIVSKSVSFPLNLINLMIKSQDKNQILIDNRHLRAFNVSFVEFGSISVLTVHVSPGTHQILTKRRVKALSVQVYGHTDGGIISGYGFPGALMDTHSMGPLPPGPSMFPTGVMIGLLTGILMMMAILFCLCCISAIMARRYRKKHPLVVRRNRRET